jgi:hypothetical protein
MTEPTEITPEDSVSPIYLVPLTEEEIAEQEKWAAEETSRQAEEQAAAAAKESALAKLAKLGLTEEEARAVIGL